ncbi:MAG: hypothetical protein MRY83_16735 [Flavobacteriales bacterium]|nr:hypothetical protein [Flavobacteriales bacterium]
MEEFAACLGQLDAAKSISIISIMLFKWKVGDWQEDETVPKTLLHERL